MPNFCFGENVENSLNNYIPHPSSWLGRETYFGYYVDWSNELFSAIPYNLSLLSIGSLYGGVYLYINGMADDLQATLKQLDQTEVEDMWPHFVDAIRFHNKIIEYGPELFFSTRKFLNIGLSAIFQSGRCHE